MSFENFMEKCKSSCVDECTLCKVKSAQLIFDEDDVVSYCTHEKFVSEDTPDGRKIASICRLREIKEASKVPSWCPLKNFSCPLHELDDI